MKSIATDDRQLYHSQSRREQLETLHDSLKKSAVVRLVTPRRKPSHGLAMPAISNIHQLRIMHADQYYSSVVNGLLPWLRVLAGTPDYAAGRLCRQANRDDARSRDDVSATHMPQVGWT